MFANRSDAGRQLAERLRRTMAAEPVVVLGLPRGGIPVAYEVATALNAPLDVIIVRKLGVPYQPELAMGAIGEGGVRIVNRDVARRTGLTTAQFQAVEAREREELARRAARFRGDHDRLSLVGQTALIVDDGIATGSTVRAGCEVARALGAARVVVAAPVAPPSAIDALSHVADEMIVLRSPESFVAIGQFYDDFTQTSDAEVVRLLDRARTRSAPDRDQEVAVGSGPVRFAGRLTIPSGAGGIVLFAHGSGSSRHSTRNRFVAGVLNRSGIGTLLFDLLTEEEERDRSNVFDIRLLGERLVDATRWLRELPESRAAPLGYFGASTGAAAALWAAVVPETQISAVVSRGGRPDLAGPRLGDVRAPTLLIVGSRDHEVLELNRRAAAQMHCETALEIVPGATHLFEEPGTLARAADLARDWFVSHLAVNNHSAHA
ncbi:MAG TPA: phosphoribosyltransferase family protein [Acidimicrobiia bacterium]|nr:phosphoribosyltransferase family protein [Acidimicrobiia bacterium]